MAPIVLELRRHPERFEAMVVATAQHRDMLDQVLEIFGIKPDVDLDLMRDGQGLVDLTARLLASLEAIWRQAPPDLVLVQGDTTSSFVASLAAYYLKTPIGHVEAGLRTRDKYAPFPEEMNRRLVDVMADFYFAPTEQSRKNLLSEGVHGDQVIVTGNTGIDALLLTLQRIQDTGFIPPELDPTIFARQKLILVTAHRRESFGEGFNNICAALKELALSSPELSILYPVHPNPNVRGPVRTHLEGIPNIHLVAPLNYQVFVYVMARADVILTDSGGVQEEAPSLAKQVLVMRDETERTEAIEAGVAELVGTRTSKIITRTRELLAHPKVIRPGDNPFGDGRAAERTIRAILERSV